MATGGTDIEKVPESRQVYHCPICLEAVKMPRGLPCLHTFCEDCLHTYITAAAEKDEKNIACPVCRKQIPAPELGISHDEWAKRFPLNYFVLNMDEGIPAQQQTEECRFCLRDDKKTHAEHYCKNCSEAVCGSCKHFHSLVPSLKNHSIVTLESFRFNPTLPDTDELCLVHPGKIIEVFCLDHKNMCCSICFATQHRHCSDVKSLHDCANELEGETVEGVVSSLESLSNKLEEHISEKVKQAENLKKSRDSAVSKMTQQVEAAEKNLRILLENFKAETDDKHSKHYSKLERVLEELRGIRTSVVCDLQMLKAIVKYASKQQIFVALEKVKLQIAERAKLAKDIAPTVITQEYTLEDEAVEAIGRLKSIGCIQSVDADKPVLSQDIISELASISIPFDEDLDRDPHSLTWTKNWSFKLGGTSYGATFLGTNIAAIPSGNRLIVINERGSEMYNHSIPYKEPPADINAVDDSTVYISFKRQKVLKKYNVTASAITEIGEITLKNVAEIFCILDSRIVHASTTEVSVSNMSGDLIKSVPRTQSGDVGFLAALPKKGIFCHTNGKSLYIRNIEGEEIKRVPLPCEKPRGLGFDFQGNIYVCCFEEGKLLQMSHRNFSTCKIPSLKDTYTIAFDFLRKSFVVIAIGGSMQYHSLE